MLAGSEPQPLTGQLITLAPASLYHSFAFQGGSFRSEMVDGWLLSAQWPFQQNLTRIRAHPAYDSYWQEKNIEERIDRIDWPVVIAAGWYDLFLQGSIDLYTSLRKNGTPTGHESVRMIVGPYKHTGFNQLSLGEVELPENALVPYGTLWSSESSFIQNWLLDEPMDVEPPRVLYYVMGELPGNDVPGNEWRTAADWPPTSQETPWYFSDAGALQTDIPNNTSFDYTYDPKNPVGTLGGQNFLLTPGMYDQTKIETRDDVLLFTSGVFNRPQEITGRVKAVLYVSSSAKDTDFTAKLTDVYPDGRSMLLADGIRRLTMREDDWQIHETIPGSIYRLEVDL